MESQSPEERQIAHAIAQLEQQWSVMNSTMMEKILALRYRVNALLPICQLPDEILLEIFMEVQYAYRLQLRPFQWVPPIAHVCRRWRDIALSAPMLWTNITNRPLSWLEPALERSQTSPLSIYLSTSCNMLPESAEQRLEQVVGNKDRLKKFGITSTPEVVEKWIMRLPSSAPFLEKLALISTRPSSPRHLEQLFKEGAPRLKKLQMRGFSANWNRSLIGRLKTFELTCFQSQLLLQTVLDALRNMPQLEKLALELNSQGTIVPPSPYTKMELPGLKYMRLRGEPRMINAILMALAIPASTELNIHCVGDSFDDHYAEFSSAISSLWTNPHNFRSDPPYYQSLRLDLFDSRIGLWLWNERIQFSESMFVALESQPAAAAVLQLGKVPIGSYHHLFNLPLTNIRSFALLHTLPTHEELSLLIAHLPCLEEVYLSEYASEHFASALKLDPAFSIRRSRSRSEDRVVTYAPLLTDIHLGCNNFGQRPRGARRRRDQSMPFHQMASCLAARATHNAKTPTLTLDPTGWRLTVTQIKDLRRRVPGIRIIEWPQGATEGQTGLGASYIQPE
ncbi:hypothetical protein CC1G_08158 [Coprinopsis cinerea okayama7|uniref:F-box domain-containing protein n=1 Tax=Coprinopsis cinerea (strain Okayama-7 / 130 / ATCC MYA-4618 / FGSC 9003) TaxID=240176 RepID=A8NZ50_COPC7|nr:hypothetical protein CC1G_08158 [Coprinopsis cinerea okayama7\|eukprot:XP_001837604.2 hypothetical protein CC1G_08158 [Coprinopsis cinerea okayama7\